MPIRREKCESYAAADEGLLGQVFGFKGVSQHAQTDAVDKPRVQPIDELESRESPWWANRMAFPKGELFGACRLGSRKALLHLGHIHLPFRRMGP